jgi:hypothetical protein
MSKTYGCGRWLSRSAEPHGLDSIGWHLKIERGTRMPVAMIFFVAAALPIALLFSQSQAVERSDSRKWMAYQGSAVALLMVTGVLGVLTEQGVMRIAWAVLVVVTIVRLSVLPRQARGRAAEG